MVEPAIYVITKQRLGEPETLFFRLLVDNEKGDLLYKLTRVYQPVTRRKGICHRSMHFDVLPGSPYLIGFLNPRLKSLGRIHPSRRQSEIRVGLQTGEDFRHLRLLWEIPNKRIVLRAPQVNNRNLSIRQQCLDQLWNAGHWVPFSKTDIASPWFSPITLVVNWENNGHELKNFTDTKGKVRSRPQNEEFYFRPGFSYMLRSTRLVPYLVPSGVMPTAGRAQIFPEQGEEYVVLGICASNVGSAVARFSGEMFARPKFQASMVQGLPSCEFPEDTLKLIKRHVDAEVNKRRAVVQRYEPYQEFSFPAWMCPAKDGETAWDLYTLFGRGLENKISEAFGLNIEQLVELERDIREAVSIRGRSEEDESEDAAEGSDEEETELNIELISETAEERAVGLLMYAVGVALGRWDVRIAIDPLLAPKLPDPFDPLPVCPPGMLVGPDGLPGEPNRIVSEEWLRARPDANTLPPECSVKTPTIPDSDYPLRISWDGVLVDDSGFNGAKPHRDDIVRRVREVFDLLWKDKAHEIEQEVCDILDVSDLRNYFRRPAGFFHDHLKRYSKSRRKAPIYWPLSTAAGSYTIWLYYHRLNDQTLYGVVNKYVEPKIAETERGIAHIEDDLKAASGRDATKLTDRLNEARAFLGELRDLREELLRIAALPYKPDLNDGVIINAAPFYKLFRLRPGPRILKTAGRSSTMATTIGRTWRTRYGPTASGKSAKRIAPSPLPTGLRTSARSWRRRPRKIQEEDRMNLPEPQSLTFSSLMSDIEKGITKIPQFQRDFVWTKEKSAKLLDSIVKGYPIGTFIFWKTKEELRALRNLGGFDLPTTPDGDYIQYVLDGQQRLTSLFASLKGLTVKREDHEDDFSEFYLDLEAQEDEPIVLTNRSDTDHHRTIRMHSLLYGKIKELAAYPEHLQDKIQAYKDRINAYQFSGILIKEAPIEVATEIFTRLNVSGKPLSVFEIMVAKTFDSKKDFDLAEKYDELISELETVDYGTISDSVVLQTVSILLCKECRKKDILGLPKRRSLISGPMPWMRSSPRWIFSEIPYEFRFPISYLILICSFRSPITFTKKKANPWVKNSNTCRISFGGLRSEVVTRRAWKAGCLRTLQRLMQSEKAIFPNMNGL